MGSEMNTSGELFLEHEKRTPSWRHLLAKRVEVRFRKLTHFQLSSPGFDFEHARLYTKFDFADRRAI